MAERLRTEARKGIAVASKVADSPGASLHAEQHGVACSPMNKSGQPSDSLLFFVIVRC